MYLGFQNRGHMVSRVRQNPDKRKPEQNQQVHDHEDASDPGFAGFGCAGADVVEIVTVLALTARTVSAITWIFPCSKGGSISCMETNPLKV